MSYFSRTWSLGAQGYNDVGVSKTKEISDVMHVGI